LIEVEKRGYLPGKRCGGEGGQITKENGHHTKRRAEQQAHAQRRQQAHICRKVGRREEGCKERKGVACRTTGHMG
jgi:hypothetical protein